MHEQWRIRSDIQWGMAFFQRLNYRLIVTAAIKINQYLCFILILFQLSRVSLFKRKAGTLSPSLVWYLFLFEDEKKFYLVLLYPKILPILLQ